MEVKKEYSHCLICRRKLKDATSRMRGIGPTCLKKFAKHKRSEPVQMEMKL